MSRNGRDFNGDRRCSSAPQASAFNARVNERNVEREYANPSGCTKHVTDESRSADKAATNARLRSTASRESVGSACSSRGGGSCVNLYGAVLLDAYRCNDSSSQSSANE